MSFNLQFGGHFGVRPRSESMSVLLMFLLKTKTTRFENVVKTWPSQSDLERAFGRGKPGEKGTFAESTRQQGEEVDRLVCKHVKRILEQKDVLPDFCDDSHLWESYRYACWLNYSRAHAVDIIQEPNSNRIYPLIDNINGFPECHLVNLKTSACQAFALYWQEPRSNPAKNCI